MARFLPVSGTPVSMTWSMVEINLVFLEVCRLPPALESIILLVSSWGLLWVKGGLPFGWNELFRGLFDPKIKSSTDNYRRLVDQKTNQGREELH